MVVRGMLQILITKNKRTRFLYKMLMQSRDCSCCKVESLRSCYEQIQVNKNVSPSSKIPSGNFSCVVPLAKQFVCRYCRWWAQASSGLT